MWHESFIGRLGIRYALYFCSRAPIQSVFENFFCLSCSSLFDTARNTGAINWTSGKSERVGWQFREWLVIRLVIRVTKPRSFIVRETSLKLRFVANESENTRGNAFRVHPRLLINRTAMKKTVVWYSEGPVAFIAQINSALHSWRYKLPDVCNIYHLSLRPILISLTAFAMLRCKTEWWLM